MTSKFREMLGEKSTFLEFLVIGMVLGPRGVGVHLECSHGNSRYLYSC